MLSESRRTELALELARDIARLQGVKARQAGAWRRNPHGRADLRLAWEQSFDDVDGRADEPTTT